MLESSNKPVPMPPSADLATLNRLWEQYGPHLHDDPEARRAIIGVARMTQAAAKNDPKLVAKRLRIAGYWASVDGRPDGPGMIVEAISVLQTAVGPHSCPADYTRMDARDALYLAGRYPEAEYFCRVNLQQVPVGGHGDWRQPLLDHIEDVAYFHQSLGQHELAAQHWAMMHHFAPERLQGGAGLARALSNLGQVARAQALCQHLIEQWQQINLALGDWPGNPGEPAVDTIDEFIDVRAPNAGDAKAILAEIEARGGRYAEADDHIQQAWPVVTRHRRDLDEYLEQVYETDARIAEGLGDSQRAVRSGQRAQAIRLAPETAVPYFGDLRTEALRPATPCTPPIASAQGAAPPSSDDPVVSAVMARATALADALMELEHAPADSDAAHAVIESIHGIQVDLWERIDSSPAILETAAEYYLDLLRAGRTAPFERRRWPHRVRLIVRRASSALRHDPDRLADLYIAAGESVLMLTPDRGVSYLQRAVELSAGSTPPWRRNPSVWAAACALRQHGLFSRAVPFFRRHVAEAMDRAAQMGPMALWTARLQTGDFYEEAGWCDMAAAQYQAMFSMSEQETEGGVRLARVLVRQGEGQRAQMIARQVIQRVQAANGDDPDAAWSSTYATLPHCELNRNIQGDAMLVLAECELASGDAAAALATVEAAMPLITVNRPRNHVAIARALEVKSAILEALGDSESATHAAAAAVIRRDPAKDLILEV